MRLLWILYLFSLLFLTIVFSGEWSGRSRSDASDLSRPDVDCSPGIQPRKMSSGEPLEEKGEFGSVMNETVRNPAETIINHC